MAHSVLVVEDEPHILLSLEVLLDKAGFDVRAAHDGDAALDEVAARPPSVMLLDVMLPKRDGYAVCEAVRANPALDDVHIVMLTAKGRETDRARGLAAGADEFITKPFSTRELIERMKAIVGTDAGGA